MVGQSRSTRLSLSTQVEERCFFSVRYRHIKILITDECVLGRSISACMKAYESLLNPPPNPRTSHYSGNVYEQLSPAAAGARKRPLPDEEPLTTADRMIQAHPFPTVNKPATADPAHQFTSPIPPTTREPPQKKRGRPSKEEHERRVREAAQRGQVYPPPKKIKTPRQSLEGVESGAVATASGIVEGATEEGSTGRKKAKKAKTTSSAMHLAPDIPARVSSLEATARAAEQMQTDTERHVEGTIPEAQGSGFSAQENLLAGMREHIAREDADAMQSGSTRRQQSAPGTELKMDLAIPNTNERTFTTQKEGEPAH